MATGRRRHPGAQMRICVTCHRHLPLEDFNADKRKPHGKRYRCKRCESLQKSAWHRNGGREIVRRNCKAWRKKTGYPGWSDPIRKRARNLAQAAVRRGVLTRKPCEYCGHPKSHAHHDDYSKPLNVRWLCDPCHKQEHPLAIRART